MMTLEEFFEMIDKWEYIPGDLLVRIGYKYTWEKFHHESNEVLEYIGDRNEWQWLNDWNEGYDDVKFLGYVPVDDVPIEAMWTPKKEVEEHQKQREKEFAIAELEKLKEEMNNYCDYHAIYDWGLIDLIDEHISELKGENDEI